MSCTCPYKGFCSQCKPEPYETEVRKKHEAIKRLFPQATFIPHPAPDNYRIRMDFITTPAAMGLRRTTYDDIVDVEDCPIFADNLNAVWKQIRLFIQQHNISCYDIQKKTGWLKYVMIRGQDHIQVTLTTATADHEALVEELFSHLQIASLVWTINNTQSNDSVGAHHKTYGTPTIPIVVQHATLAVDPWSFFQASLAPMELVLEEMKQYIADTVLDVYCGVGTIGIALKPRALIGIETNEHALALAKQNAESNNQEAVFYSRLHATGDVIIVDPPRTGLQSTVHFLLAKKPHTIIYLSCNPKTQRTDVAALSSAYTIKSVTGYDFFPRTAHVESLAILSRR